MMSFALFAVGVMVLFAFLHFALMRKVILRYYAKCINNAKNANNAITMRLALIAVGAIAFFSFCANCK